MYYDPGETIIIHTAHIQRLLDYPKTTRNQLVHLLAARMGLRTLEIATMRREDINIESGDVYITDSKKHRLYPIPLAWDVAQLIQKLFDETGQEGWLIRRHVAGRKPTHLNKPLSREEIWHIVRRHAVKANVPNPLSYNPRLLRHFFAANFAKGRNNQPGNLEVLRRILRHRSLAYTQVYLARLVFWEDVKAEFNRLQEIPQIERRNDNVSPFWYIEVTEKLNEDFEEAWKSAGYKTRAEALRDQARKLIDALKKTNQSTPTN